MDRGPFVIQRGEHDDYEALPLPRGCYTFLAVATRLSGR